MRRILLIVHKPTDYGKSCSTRKRKKKEQRPRWFIVASPTDGGTVRWSVIGTNVRGKMSVDKAAYEKNMVLKIRWTFLSSSEPKSASPASSVGRRGRDASIWQQDASSWSLHGTRSTCKRRIVKRKSSSRIGHTSRTCQPPKFTSKGSSTRKSHRTRKLSFACAKTLRYSSTRAPVQDGKEAEDNVFEEENGKDFRSMSGDFIHRRHGVQKTKLSFTMPMKHVDRMRQREQASITPPSTR